MVNEVDYENKALLYAEKYGVIEYTVDDNKMTYFEEVNEGQGIIAVYVSNIDLDTMNEVRNHIK